MDHAEPQRSQKRKMFEREEEKDGSRRAAETTEEGNGKERMEMKISQRREERKGRGKSMRGRGGKMERRVFLVSGECGIEINFCGNYFWQWVWMNESVYCLVAAESR